MADEADMAGTTEEHWWGELWRYSCGRVSAVVMDRDGDSSSWSVKIDGERLCWGECWDFQSFETAIACAKIAIRAALHDVPHRVRRPVHG